MKAISIIFLKYDNPPGIIQQITRDHIVSYGKFLKSEFDRGKRISTASATSYLSGMNALMKLIDSDWEKVSAIHDRGHHPLFV